MGSTLEAELLSLFQKERDAFAKRCRVRELEIERKEASLRLRELELAEFASMQRKFGLQLKDLRGALQALVETIHENQVERDRDPKTKELAELRAENRELQNRLIELRKMHRDTVSDLRLFISNESTN